MEFVGAVRELVTIKESTVAFELTRVFVVIFEAERLLFVEIEPALRFVIIEEPTVSLDTNNSPVVIPDADKAPAVTLETFKLDVDKFVKFVLIDERLPVVWNTTILLAILLLVTRWLAIEAFVSTMFGSVVEVNNRFALVVISVVKYPVFADTVPVDIETKFPLVLLPPPLPPLPAIVTTSCKRLFTPNNCFPNDLLLDILL